MESVEKTLQDLAKTLEADLEPLLLEAISKLPPAYAPFVTLIEKAAMPAILKEVDALIAGI